MFGSSETKDMNNIWTEFIDNEHCTYLPTAGLTVTPKAMKMHLLFHPRSNVCNITKIPQQHLLLSRMLL
jgi:hypothetical protein